MVGPPSRSKPVGVAEAFSSWESGAFSGLDIAFWAIVIALIVLH
jgi:hypothetical protein